MAIIYKINFSLTWNNQLWKSRKCLLRLQREQAYQPLPPNKHQPTKNEDMRSLSFVATLTCRVLCLPDGSGHGRPRDEHSRLGQGWRLSGYSARKCGTTGRLESATHQLWSDCRPIRRNNETAGWYPEDRGEKAIKITINFLCKITARLKEVKEICSYYIIIEISMEQ